MSVVVSINCITYNHEPYIGEAIEGFLSQQTNFEFEILIGEDCSTDQTRKIIDKYVTKYPTKIKLITSGENVGALKNAFRLHEQSQGKYIALCEGDDYWTDPFKLQKQVDYMEKNPDCTLCFHNAKVLGPNKEETGKIVVPWLKNNEKYFRKDNHYTAGELALLGYIPTASFLYPKCLLDNFPDWAFHSVAGDNVVKLITSSHGYAYYIDEIMCIYRFGIEGSATTKWSTENTSKDKIINHHSKFIELFDDFNSYSHYKYDTEILEVKKIFEFEIAILQGELKSILSKKYKDIWRELNLIEKIKIISRSKFPNIYTKLTEMKKAIQL